MCTNVLRLKPNRQKGVKMKEVCRILGVKFFAFKPFVALFALASVASNVAAERSGAFVGAEIGMSGGGGGKI